MLKKFRNIALILALVLILTLCFVHTIKAIVIVMIGAIVAYYAIKLFFKLKK